MLREKLAPQQRRGCDSSMISGRTSLLKREATMCELHDGCDDCRDALAPRLRLCRLRRCLEDVGHALRAFVLFEHNSRLVSDVGRECLFNSVRDILSLIKSFADDHDLFGCGDPGVVLSEQVVGVIARVERVLVATLEGTCRLLLWFLLMLKWN